jgi:hypothetical protein
VETDSQAKADNSSLVIASDNSQAKANNDSTARASDNCTAEANNGEFVTCP